MKMDLEHFGVAQQWGETLPSKCSVGEHPIVVFSGAFILVTMRFPAKGSLTRFTSNITASRRPAPKVQTNSIL
jgi:hypothetical protein